MNDKTNEEMETYNLFKNLRIEDNVFTPCGDKLSNCHDSAPVGSLAYIEDFDPNNQVMIVEWWVKVDKDCWGHMNDSCARDLVDYYRKRRKIIDTIMHFAHDRRDNYCHLSRIGDFENILLYRDGKNNQEFFIDLEIGLDVVYQTKYRGGNRQEASWISDKIMHAIMKNRIDKKKTDF